MNQPAQQISFNVSGLVFSNLAKRSVPLNIRPAEYARRLFEAAYAGSASFEVDSYQNAPPLKSRSKVDRSTP